jgi:hypothetical protein
MLSWYICSMTHLFSHAAQLGSEAQRRPGNCWARLLPETGVQFSRPGRNSRNAPWEMASRACAIECSKNGRGSSPVGRSAPSANLPLPGDPIQRLSTTRMIYRSDRQTRRRTNRQAEYAWHRVRMATSCARTRIPNAGCVPTQFWLRKEGTQYGARCGSATQPTEAAWYKRITRPLTRQCSCISWHIRKAPHTLS